MSYVIKDATVAVVGNTFEQRIELGLAMAPLLEALGLEARAG
jgi:hypothetical protein